MTSESIQASDLIPFVRPGVKANYKTTAEQLMSGASGIQLSHTNMVDDGNPQASYQIGGSIYEPFTSPSVEFAHNYRAAFANPSNDVARKIEYGIMLDVITSASQAGLDAAAALAGSSVANLVVTYLIASLVRVAAQAEYMDNRVVFQQNYMRLGSGVYMREKRHELFLQSNIHLPPGAAATVRHELYITSAQYQGVALPIQVAPIFDIRVLSNEITETLNTKTF